MTNQTITQGTTLDKNGLQWETISTPSFEFRMLFRQLDFPDIPADRGATLEVYGRDGEQWRELLKFDCFEKGPHWHRCYPDAPDDIAPLEATSFGAGVDFAVAQLSDNFGRLVAEQRFAHFASDDKLAELSSALPAVERRMRRFAREEGPVQIQRPRPKE